MYQGAEGSKGVAHTAGLPCSFYDPTAYFERSGGRNIRKLCVSHLHCLFIPEEANGDKAGAPQP